jgi:hypothetical protein
MSQYERLCFCDSLKIRLNNMTIQDAIDKASEGGYHLQGSDGVDTEYSGASREYSAWTRQDTKSSFMVAVEETFLDPQFWQALGQGLGWDQAIKTLHIVDNGRPTMVTSTGQSWLSHWHGFVDCLAEGKTPEDYFAQLDA